MVGKHILKRKLCAMNKRVKHQIKLLPDPFSQARCQELFTLMILSSQILTSLYSKK